MKSDSLVEMLSEAYKQFAVLDKAEAKRVAKENAERAKKKKELDSIALSLKDSADKRALYLKKLDETAGRKGDAVKNKHHECVDNNQHLLDILLEYYSITGTISDQDRETAVARLKEVNDKRELDTLELEEMISEYPDISGISAKPQAVPARPAKNGWLKAALAAGLIASGIGGYWAYSSHTADVKKLNEACDAAVEVVRKEAAKAGKPDPLAEANENIRQTNEIIAKINKNLAESGSPANTANGRPVDAFKMQSEINAQNRHLREKLAPFIWSQPRNPQTEVGVKELEQRLASAFDSYLDSLVKENKIVGWEKMAGRSYCKNKDNYELKSIGYYEVKTSKNFAVPVASGVIELIENLESHNIKVDKRGPGLRGQPTVRRLRSKSPEDAKLIESYLDQLVKDQRIIEWVEGATFLGSSGFSPQMAADYAAVLPGGKMFCIDYDEKNVSDSLLSDFSGLGMVLLGKDRLFEQAKDKIGSILSASSLLDDFVKDKKIRSWSLGVAKAAEQEYLIELAEGAPKREIAISQLDGTAKYITVFVQSLIDNARNKASSSPSAAKDPVKELFANLDTIMKKTGHDPAAAFKQNDLAGSLRGQGKLDDAVSEYVKAVEFDPDNAVIYNNLGAALDDLKRFDDALSAYKKSIEINPNNAFVHSNLCVTLRHLGKFDEAILSQRKAVELDPGNASYRSYLGWYLSQAGNFDEALSLCKKAIEIDPKDADIHHTLGVIFDAQKKFDDAVSLHKRAVELKPDFYRYHGSLGESLRGQGKLEEAVLSLNKAISLNPKSDSAYHSLGLALDAQGKDNEAIVAYKKAIELAPDCANTHYNLGTIYQGQGKYLDAMMHFNNAIKFDKNHFLAHNYLGDVYFALLRFDEAVSAYRKAVEINPKSIMAHTDLGAALCKQGKLEDAVASYRTAISIDQKNADLHVYLGLTLNNLHKQDDAISAYKKAIKLNPKYATAHNNLGSILFGQGKFDEAEKRYRQAVSINPKESICHYNLGHALRSQGKNTDAVASLNTAISLNPKNDSAYAHLGAILYDLERYDDAVLAYAQAVKLAPREPVYHYNFAVTLVKQEKTVEAKKHYKIAADLGIEDAKKRIAELEANK